MLSLLLRALWFLLFAEGRSLVTKRVLSRQGASEPNDFCIRGSCISAFWRQALAVAHGCSFCSLGWVTCGLGLLGQFVAGILGRQHMTVPMLKTWIPTCAVLGLVAFIIVSHVLSCVGKMYHLVVVCLSVDVPVFRRSVEVHACSCVLSLCMRTCIILLCAAALYSIA